MAEKEIKIGFSEAKMEALEFSYRRIIQLWRRY